MPHSTSRISGTHRSAFKLHVTTLFALLVFAISGAWSPVRAQGPALWIAHPAAPNAVGGVIEVRPYFLTKSGVPNRVRIASALAPLANTAGIAFQPNGNLWLSTFTGPTNGGNALLRFTPTQLNNLSTGVHPHPTPSAIIKSSSYFGAILGVVFDSQVNPNLWVVDDQNDAVYEVSHAQVIAGGTTDITPKVIITSTDLASPSFGAFDTAGNLWVSSLSNNRIVEFSASQLASPGGALLGNIVISSPSLDNPGQLQFDSAGNLWVANYGSTINPNSGTVVAFTHGQLTASGSPIAQIILSDDGSGSLDGPWGLQFDSLNRLWVSNYTTGTIVRYGTGQVLANGSPTPKVTLSGLASYSGQIIFGPRH